MTRGKRQTTPPESSPPRPGARRRPASRALRHAPQPDARALLHELRVHQVELEMQNEELRGARLESEAALARYTEIFDFAPIGYATVSLDHALLEINHAGAQLLGAVRSSLQGRSLLGLVHPEHHGILRGLISAAEVSGIKQSASLDLLRHPARRVPVRLSVVVLPQARSGLLLAFEDIAELDQHRHKLEQSDRALREADRRKDEFLALLSHELRNPLAPIRTSLFLLGQAPPGGDVARRAQQIIDRQVTHLTRLIDDLLDATRIGRGKVRLALEPVELSSLLWRVVEDHRASFEAEGVALAVEQNPACWVNADGARLTQVVSNLLSNALKFTARGGRVLLCSRLLAEHVVLSVADTGAGIEQELLQHVFEPFVQSPQTLDRSGGGLGLGLALVRGLVELHGGEVSVHSAGEGQGAEVTLRLPLIPAPVARADGLRQGGGSAAHARGGV